MIKHTPCITDEEVISRIVEDKLEIELMRARGYSVVTMVSYQSPTTFECHCLPIFTNDKLEDIVNRYHDFFPKDLMQAVEEMNLENQYLYSANGMSEAGTIMSFGKIPCGLQKMLDIWCGGDFLEPTEMRKNLAKLFSYIPKLKAGRSYGQKTFAT